MDENPRTSYLQHKLKRLFLHERLWKVIPLLMLAVFLVFRYYGACSLRSFAENEYSSVKKVTYVEFTPHGTAMQTLYATTKPAEIGKLMDYFSTFFIRPTFFESGNKGGGTWWVNLEFENGTKMRIAIDQWVAVGHSDDRRACRYILRRPSVKKISQLAYSIDISQN